MRSRLDASRAVPPRKANELIAETLFGSVRAVRDTQLWKATEPMVSSAVGRATEVSDLQLQKVPLLRTLMAHAERSAEARALQSWKAPCSMEVTDAGRVMDAKEEHRKNALSLTLLRPGAMEMEMRDEHS